MSFQFPITINHFLSAPVIKGLEANGIAKSSSVDEYEDIELDDDDDDDDDDDEEAGAPG